MSKYSVNKPVTVLMGILIVMVLGVFSFTKLSLGLFPDMELPYVVVVTPYAGAEAEEVLEDVTKVIESKVTSMTNFKEVTSTSSDHYSVVMIEFQDGTNMDSVSIALRQTLDNISFPDGVTKSTIMNVSPDMLPVLTVSISAEYADLDDEQEFIKATEFVKNELLDRFNKIPGVAEVGLMGAADVVLEVQLDQQKLSSLGITTEEVLELINEQNNEQMVGIALDNGQIRMLYIGNAIENIDEVKKLPIPIIVDGTNKVFKLSELAVKDGIKFVNNNSESYSKVNGKQSISISFQKQSGVAITDVTDEINKVLEEITAEYGNVSYQIVLDQGAYVNLAVGSVTENLIWGAVLAVVILFIFLRNIRPTLIVGITIPVSVIATFMCMYFVGIDLNMLSMGGLALGIGMLVDNSIVVIENIYRLLSEGKTKKEAAIYGAKQVASAITASTLTTIVVFLPIVFLGGLVADIFMNMAYTIAFSLLSSLIISLTMVPTLASRYLKNKQPKVEKKNSKFDNFYEKILKYSLNHKLVIFISAILLFGIVLLLSSTKGFVMMPNTDEGSISATITVTPNTKFAVMSDYTDKLVDKIRENEEIKSVSASFGSSSGMMGLVSGSDSNVIDLNISLTNNHKTSTKVMTSKVETIINNFDFDEVEGMDSSTVSKIEVTENNNSMSMMMTSGVSIRVKGFDLEKLESVALDIAAIVESVEGTTKVSNGINKSNDNVKILVDKDKAAELGLTQKDYVNSLNLVFEQTNLDSLAGENTITVNFNGIDYVLNIPSDLNIGGLNLSDLLVMFGSYEDFLRNFYIFDKSIYSLLKSYKDSIYTFLPVTDGTDVTGFKLALNPLIYYNKNEQKIVTIDPSNSSDISNIAIGNYVPLKKMAKTFLGAEGDSSTCEIKKVTQFSSILSDGKYSYINVTGLISNEYNVTKVSSIITEKVNSYLSSEDFKYKDSVQIEFSGENEEIMETVGQMIIAVIIAILLVYMVIAIQFQSLIQPLIVMGTLPLAFTGGLGFVLIFNLDLSVVAIIGLVVLVGIAVNNGIVLIDYINQLINEGMKIKDACIKAGLTRLRPILMTALTTIFGLVIMALGLSNGSELLQPLAVTAIGGLLYSTLLTLVVIPVIYCGLKRKQIKKENEIIDNER